MTRAEIALHFAVMLASRGVPMDRSFELADEFIALASKKAAELRGPLSAKEQATLESNERRLAEIMAANGA